MLSKENFFLYVFKQGVILVVLCLSVLVEVCVSVALYELFFLLKVRKFTFAYVTRKKRYI